MQGPVLDHARSLVSWTRSEQEQSSGGGRSRLHAVSGLRHRSATEVEGTGLQNGTIGSGSGAARDCDNHFAMPFCLDAPLSPNMNSLEEAVAIAAMVAHRDMFGS